MARLVVEERDDSKILRLDGILSIQDASALRNCLLEILPSGESLLIDLSGAESIDLACIQVLCSAHKTWLKAHKNIGITANIPECVVKSLAMVAVVPGICNMDTCGRCLWPTGGKDE